MPFLSASLSRNPEALAVDGPDRALSYRELAREAEYVARRLRGLGVGEGEVVAVKGALSHRSLTALHGIWMTGATAAPLHSGWSEEEEEQALKVLQPTLVLVEGSVEVGREDGGRSPGRSSSTQPPVRRTFSLDTWEDSHLPRFGAVEPMGGPLPEPDPEFTAAQLLTSGTTRKSRPIAITVGNLLASAHASVERLDLGASDRWFGSLSPAHVGGLALVTRASVVGSTLVLRGPFRADKFIELVLEGRVTHASLVPTMLHRLLRDWGEEVVPDSLQCLLLGGAPAPEEMVREGLERGFPLALTYGLTEASSQVATAHPALVRRRPGTVGAPLPGVQVRLAPSGELQVRGPTVSPGALGSDGWLHTGDLALQDDDGHLWITGRMSDRIISGGVNVDPEDVEASIRAHPGVEEVAVVGLPDREWGERIVAAVTLGGSRGLAVQELERYARSNLAPSERPKAFRIVETLPRNANGKVDRERLRALFL